jgi:uncharacterized membrane protein
MKHSQKLNRLLLLVVSLLSVVGFIDSLYLTITHYTNALVPCNFTQGCETVLRSSYSEIFGIPLASLGIVFYIVTLSSSIFFIQHNSFHKWLSIWGLVGFLSTLYLLFIQAFILRAFCQYCLLSALTSSLIFAITTVLYFKNRQPKSDLKKST